MPDMPGKVPLGSSNRPARRKTSERGYGHSHQMARARLKQLHPVCQRCGLNWSEHLHHLDHDTQNTDPTNLQMWCRECHKKEHGGHA